MNGAIPHPIPYQGSKRGLAAAILPHFPPGPFRLVEPFAGSAAISLAAAHSRLTTSFWLNDAHPALVSLWREIIHTPYELSAKYESHWIAQQGHEREYFTQVRRSFNQSQEPGDFLYLLARCVKAAIRYNSSGEFNNTPDNRRKGAMPKEMLLRVTGAASLLSPRTQLTALDYKDVLASCTTNDVVYMDPPYQGVCNARDNRYSPKVDHGEFWNALEELNRRNIRYLVSYDGRTGDKRYGSPMPKHLDLTLVELCAGRSTQATLLGRECITYESLYLSPSLTAKIGPHPGRRLKQLDLSLV